MLRQRLLDALAAEMRPWTTPETLALRLAEADAHIEQAIAARMEIGLDREAAEREAVAAFGEARAVGAAHGRSDFARSLAVRLRWVGAAYLATLAIYAAINLWMERVAFLPSLILPALWIGAFGLSVSAFRSRRPAALHILATGLGASLLFWAFFGVIWLNLWNYGGIGYEFRWRADEARQEAISLRAAKPARPTSSENIDAIPAAQADPVGNALSLAGNGFSTGMGIAAYSAAIDLVAAGLGAAWAARRRRRPGVA